VSERPMIGRCQVSRRGPSIGADRTVAPDAIGHKAEELIRGSSGTATPQTVARSGRWCNGVTRLTPATAAIRVGSQDSCFGVDTGLVALRMRA